ncbi:Eco47II family restriction endonuclease [Epilithonimonas ginsengisoli]|uniref:Eco47II family restriction endonuclease n=1 Tax=Epilithonimonas ginsengisoli TaxID=1245592 RepID=A0ABU4JDK6_9FLAO|nr:MULTISPECIES: Eco47II family restriction endonuclease [Chryseobacterium group]MDW8547759.1 Eco47II family restriction endonuclease [Epilithonimonas ginsengisoli]
MAIKLLIIIRMANKYVNFITDEHLLFCIENLHKAYLRAKNNITKKNFYSNKVDTIKLTFDSKFNDINEENLIQSEILRQIDKSINNSIGTFHEQILGGIEGFEVGNLSGFDVKADDDTLFADIKNKHNTMNSSSSEALFQKLARYADDYKKAKCYWVQILAKNSFNELWKGEINGKEYSHSRVYKISGDQFYALLSGEQDALLQLYKALPVAINDYLNSIEHNHTIIENSAIDEIKLQTVTSNKSILDQITFDNYNYYLGFDKL